MPHSRLLSLLRDQPLALHHVCVRKARGGNLPLRSNPALRARAITSLHQQWNNVEHQYPTNQPLERKFTQAHVYTVVEPDAEESSHLTVS